MQRRGLPNELYETIFPSLAPLALFDVGGGDNADDGDLAPLPSSFPGCLRGLPRRLLPAAVAAATLSLEVTTGLTSIDAGRTVGSSFDLGSAVNIP